MIADSQVDNMWPYIYQALKYLATVVITAIATYLITVRIEKRRASLARQTLAYEKSLNTQHEVIPELNRKMEKACVAAGAVFSNPSDIDQRDRVLTIIQEYGEFYHDNRINIASDTLRKGFQSLVGYLVTVVNLCIFSTIHSEEGEAMMEAAYKVLYNEVKPLRLKLETESHSILHPN